MTIARRAVISGRVQGVSFRAWTVAMAEDLGLRGWVRNRADGAVDLEVEGPENAVGQLLSRCREGPPPAVVDDVTVEEAQSPVWLPDGRAAEGFRQID